MRKLILLFAVPVLFIACDKEDRDDNNNLVPLSIIATDSPASITKGSTIVSEVRCSGTDLCYSFAKFELKETATREFEVRAKATYPKSPTACPQAIYTVDTTLSIQTTNSGQHIIRFYNDNTLFKTDTVQVN